MWSTLPVVMQMLFVTGGAMYSDADYRLWQKSPLGVGAESIIGIAHHPTESSSLVLADSGGGLFMSDDLGRTWFPRAQNIPVYLARDSPFPGCRIQGVFWFKNSQGGATLFVTTTGGLFRSADGGETFSLISIPLSLMVASNSIEYQDPLLRMASHPLDPDVVYVANGLTHDHLESGLIRDEPRVYFSDDGGLTFPRYTSIVLGLKHADIEHLLFDPLRLNCSFAAYGPGKTLTNVAMGAQLAYTSDGGRDWDSIASWWEDVNTTFKSMYAKGAVQAIVFSSDGLSLAMAFADNSIEIGYRMNATAGWAVKRLGTVPMYNFGRTQGARIRSLAFHPHWDRIGADPNWNGTFLYTVVSYNTTQFPNITNEVYAMNCTSLRYNTATEESRHNGMPFNSAYYNWPFRTYNCQFKLDSAAAQVQMGSASQSTWLPTSMVVPPASWRTPTPMFLVGPHELYLSLTGSNTNRDSVYDSEYNCCGQRWSHFAAMGSLGDPPKRSWEPLCSTRANKLSGFRGCGFEVVTITAVSGPPSEPNDVFVATETGLGQLSRDGGRTWLPAAADIQNALDAGGWRTPPMARISILSPVNSVKGRLLMVLTNTSGGSRAVVAYQDGEFTYMDLPANESAGFPPTEPIGVLSSNPRMPDLGHVAVDGKLYELRGMDKRTLVAVGRIVAVQASAGLGNHHMSSSMIGHREVVRNITIGNCTIFPHNCTSFGDQTYQLPESLLNTTSEFTSAEYCRTCYINTAGCPVGRCAHTMYATTSEAILRYLFDGIKTLRSRWSLGRVCTASRYVTGLQTDCRALVSPRIELRTNLLYQEYSVNIYEHFQQVLITSTGKMYLISNISVYEATEGNSLVANQYHADWSLVLSASSWRPDRSMVFGHAAVIEGSAIQLVVGLMDNRHQGAQADWKFDPHASQVAIGVQTANGMTFTPRDGSPQNTLWTAGELPPDSVNYFWSPPNSAKHVYAVSAASGVWTWHQNSLLQNGGFEQYDLTLTYDSSTKVHRRRAVTNVEPTTMLGWSLTAGAVISDTISAFGNKSALLDNAGVVTTYHSIAIDSRAMYRITGWWSGTVTCRIVHVPDMREHLVNFLPATPHWQRFSLDISVPALVTGMQLRFEGTAAGAAVDHVWLGLNQESRMLGPADMGLIVSLPPLACGVPVMTAATSRTLSIEWTAPVMMCTVRPGGCVYEPMSSYTVQYWLEGDVSSSVTIEVGNVLSYRVTRLQYATTYAIRVRATNVIGPGLWSDPTTATCLTIAPDPPDPPTVVTARSVELELAWLAPLSDGGSPVDAYRIEVLDIWYNTWSEVISVGAVNAVEITGVEPDTTYTYRVTARNSVGWGRPSEPAEPITTKAEKDSNATIRLNLWSQPWTGNYPYGTFCYPYLQICAKNDASDFWELLKLDIARSLECNSSRIVITAVWDNDDPLALANRIVKRGSHVSFWIKTSGDSSAPSVAELKKRLLWQVVDLATSKLHKGVVSGNETLESRYLYFDGVAPSNPTIQAARQSLGGSSYRLDETTMNFIVMGGVVLMFTTQLGERLLQWWRARQVARAYKESYN